MNSITRDFGGKERVFSFGLGFLGNLFEETSFTISNIDEQLKTNPFKNIPLIIYYSLVFNYVRKGERPDFDLYDVSEWIEEKGGLQSEFITDYFINFNKSMTKDVPADNSKSDKKKVA